MKATLNLVGFYICSQKLMNLDQPPFILLYPKLLKLFFTSYLLHTASFCFLKVLIGIVKSMDVSIQVATRNSKYGLFFLIYTCKNNQSCENNTAVFNYIKQEVSLFTIRLHKSFNDYLYPFRSHKHDSDYLQIGMLLGKFPAVSPNPIPLQKQSISFSFLPFQTFLWTKVTQGYMTKGFPVALLAHGRRNLMYVCSVGN